MGCGWGVEAPLKCRQTLAGQTQSGGIICRNQMLMMCLDYAQQMPVKNGIDDGKQWGQKSGWFPVFTISHFARGWGLENVPGDIVAAWRRILFKWRIIMADSGCRTEHPVMMQKSVERENRELWQALCYMV